MMNDYPILSSLITLCISSLVGYFLGFISRDLFFKKRIYADIAMEINGFLGSIVHEDAVDEIKNNKYNHTELQMEWRNITVSLIFPRRSNFRKEFVFLNQKVGIYFNLIGDYNNNKIQFSKVQPARRDAQDALKKLLSKLGIETF